MEKLREAGLMEEKETHGFEVVGTDKLRGRPMGDECRVSPLYRFRWAPGPVATGTRTGPSPFGTAMPCYAVG
jgi:hypothetical protein